MSSGPPGLPGRNGLENLSPGPALENQPKATCPKIVFQLKQNKGFLSSLPSLLVWVTKSDLSRSMPRSGDADGRGRHEMASQPLPVWQLDKRTWVPEPKKVAGC